MPEPTKPRRRRRSGFDRTIEATVLVGSLFLVAPLIMVVLNSIGPAGLARFPPPYFSLEPYWSVPEKWVNGLVNSLVLALAASLAAGVLGTCAALGLWRWRNGFARTLTDVLLRSPLQAPALVMGLAFLQYYAWLNAAASIEFRGRFLGLLLAHTAVSIPYVLAIVLARLETFDKSLEEAAYGLGAGRWQTLRGVTIPILLPAILSGMFFSFLLSFDNVPLSLFLIAGSSHALLPVDLFLATQFDLSRTVYAISTMICLGTTLAVGLVFRRLTSVVAVGRM